MFKKFFRISPQSFELVCQLLGANEQLAKRTYRGGRQEIPLEKKVMIVLRYLASQETILGISDRFNITVSTFTKYREKVVNAINDLLPRFVQWPEELDSVAIKFNEMGTYEFQNIIGAIDGSHIPIEQPLECPNSYYNRKKFHSVILQAVCKDDLSFVNICVVTDEKLKKFESSINNLAKNVGTVNKRIDEIEKGMEFVNSSFEVSKTERENLKSTVSEIQINNGEIVTHLDDIRRNLNHLTERHLDLQTRSMRENLVFSGIPHKDEETIEETENIIKNFMYTELKMETTVGFHRAHRFGKETEFRDKKMGG
ncbi:unnamed protein product [Mytilus edulis]|uniref:Nuclease HARBI1 n=1 Tax=Mytilus edulis TaxID=6550 RepID=A0A8S3QRE5_MYTED|nr:unnamed protein product [Mytilus edulis]